MGKVFIFALFFAFAFSECTLENGGTQCWNLTNVDGLKIGSACFSGNGYLSYINELQGCAITETYTWTGNGTELPPSKEDGSPDLEKYTLAVIAEPSFGAWISYQINLDTATTEQCPLYGNVQLKISTYANVVCDGVTSSDTTDDKDKGGKDKDGDCKKDKDDKDKEDDGKDKEDDVKDKEDDGKDKEDDGKDKEGDCKGGIVEVSYFVMTIECQCETCNNNGIQDQGEDGLDCGGPCPECDSTCRTLVDGYKFRTHTAGGKLFPEMEDSYFTVLLRKVALCAPNGTERAISDGVSGELYDMMTFTLSGEPTGKYYHAWCGVYVDVPCLHRECSGTAPECSSAGTLSGPVDGMSYCCAGEWTCQSGCGLVPCWPGGTSDEPSIPGIYDLCPVDPECGCDEPGCFSCPSNTGVVNLLLKQDGNKNDAYENANSKSEDRSSDAQSDGIIIASAAVTALVSIGLAVGTVVRRRRSEPALESQEHEMESVEEDEMSS